MGKQERVSYNENDVTNQLIKISEEYGRMPSCKEVTITTGNTSLSNKISRSGGFIFWSNKLNLKMKESETLKGIKYQEIARNILKDKGYSVSETSIKCPYDLVLNELIRIDVKVATEYGEKGKYSVHSFGINKEFPSSDFYMCIALNRNEEIERILIIPSIRIKNKSTISIGANSKYNKYINAFNLIDKYIDFYKEDD